MNVLLSPLIRVTPTETTAPLVTLTLPDTLAWLMRDAVGSFPALRPHQRHAWHSFLVSDRGQRVAPHQYVSAPGDRRRMA